MRFFDVLMTLKASSLLTSTFVLMLSGIEHAVDPMSKLKIIQVQIKITGALTEINLL